ncbi:chloride channel protein, partial [Marivirga lumbricoides]
FSEIDSSFFMVLFVAAIILIKPVATALTLGSGGSGGIFAPSLFIGGVTGYLFAYLINLTGIAEPISTSNFTLVGMSGVMSGVLHAPLTAIFLIAEITSGYTLFVPLMIVSAISYSTISYFEKYSLYTKPLIEKGDLIYHDKDRQVLSLIDLKKIVETDLLTIDPNASLGSLVDLVRFSKRNIFPVVNEQQELMGIVTLDDIREIMFDTDSRKNIIVNTLMHSPPTYVSSKESMQSVMIKFEKTGAWNLPVIDEGKYIGFVSKSRIFNAYRKKLIRQQID